MRRSLQSTTKLENVTATHPTKYRGCVAIYNLQLNSKISQRRTILTGASLCIIYNQPKKAGFSRSSVSCNASFGKNLVSEHRRTPTETGFFTLICGLQRVFRKKPGL